MRRWNARPGVKPRPLNYSEINLLHSLSNGVMTDEIARNMGVTRTSVNRRIQRLCLKLDALTPPHLVAVAFRRRIIK